MPAEVSADIYKEALCCEVFYHRALPRLPLVLFFKKNKKIIHAFIRTYTVVKRLNSALIAL
jgi:hypothetical protein